MFQQSFWRGAEQGELIIMHKKHIRAGIAFLHVWYVASAEGQGSEKRREVKTWKIFPSRHRLLYPAHDLFVLFVALATDQCHGFDNLMQNGLRRLGRLMLQLLKSVLQPLLLRQTLAEQAALQRVGLLLFDRG